MRSRTRSDSDSGSEGEEEYGDEPVWCLEWRCVRAGVLWLHSLVPVLLQYRRRLKHQLTHSGWCTSTCTGTNARVHTQTL